MARLNHNLYTSLPLRKLKQVILLFLTLLAVWFGAVVMYKGYPSSGIVSYLPDDYNPVKSLEQLECEHEQRKQLVKNVCEMVRLKTKPENLTNLRDFLDHVIVDDDHQLLYCYVPKVACTNWKRVLMVAMGKANSSNPQEIVPDDAHRQHVFRRLSNYSVPEIEHRISRYTKFMFVRHPFERLLSAYRNKFYQNYTSSEYFRSRYGKLIVNTYRSNASNESLTRGHDVTFPEFVQYLTDPRTTRRGPFNEHWRPILELCQPCQVEYDIIGKYETLLDDAWVVIHKSNLNGTVSFPRTEKPSETPSLLSSYMDSLSRDQILQLYNLFEADFRLFDYHYPGIE